MFGEHPEGASTVQGARRPPLGGDPRAEGRLRPRRARQVPCRPAPSFPKEFIAGTVGAGDAFASGLLLGAYRDRPMEEALEYAIAAAVTSLSKGDASEGGRSFNEALKLLGTLREGRLY